MRYRSIQLLLALLTPLAVSAQTSAPQSGGDARVIVGAELKVVSSNAAVRDSQLQIGQMFGPPAVRAGEHDAAPWLDDLAAPSSVGRIVRSVELPGVAMAAEGRAYFQLSERLYIAPPPGAIASTGQMFVTLSRGAAVGDDARVLVPTGVLRVESGGASGEAAIAKIVRQFGSIRPDDILVPFTALGVQRTGLPQAFSGGPSGEVAWVNGGRVLPSLQTYLIVNAGASAGVQLGDVFTLYRPRTQTEGGIWIPEKEIARARVVKISPRGSTLFVIDQTEPAIQVGVAARVTARMR